MQERNQNINNTTQQNKMSQTERITGTLRKLDRKGVETTGDVKKRIWEATETEPYSEDEWDFKDYWKKYVVAGNDVYEILYKEDHEPDDCYCDLKYNPDNTIDFSTSFYNGGTCLNEMLEEALTS